MRVGLLIPILLIVSVGIGVFLVIQRDSEPIVEETIKEVITVSEGEEVMVEKEIFVTNGIKHSIPLKEFIVGIGGGSGKDAVLRERLPKDAIPSIDNPKYEGIGEASGWLEDEEPGVAFSQRDTHRFYPFRILV